MPGMTAIIIMIGLLVGAYLLGPALLKVVATAFKNPLAFLAVVVILGTVVAFAAGVL